MRTKNERSFHHHENDDSRARAMSAPSDQRPRSSNDQLMRAMGSTRGADPIPPSQYLFFLDGDQPPLQRLLAAVRATTIRYRRQENGGDGRSAFCVDEKGKELGLADLAKMLDYDLSFTAHVAQQAEALGLIRRDGRKVFLVGEVPKLETGKKKGNVECTLHLDKATWLKIKDREKSARDEIIALFEAAQAYEAARVARAVAETRDEVAPIYDNIRRRHGLEVRRLPKRRDTEPLEVPQMLFEFVQSTSVRSTGGVRTNGEETGENGSVRSAHIRNSENSEKTSPPPASATSENRSVGRSSAESDRPTDPVPFPTELKREDALDESLERLLGDELAHLKETPTLTLRRQIIDGLKGAPLEYLQAKIQRKRAKIHSLGLVRDLAQEVGRAWLRERGAHQRAAEAREAHDAHAIEHNRRVARETLDDPRAAPDEKELAREILGINSKTTGGGG